MSFKSLVNSRFPPSLLLIIYLLKNLIYLPIKFHTVLIFLIARGLFQLISDLFNWIISGMCSFIRMYIIMSVFHSFSFILAITDAQ